MKKQKLVFPNSFLAFLFLLCIIGNIPISAAPLHFEPVAKQLPDGTVLNLFVSGDEFFNYLHDVNEFPLGIGSDGFYYYLIQDGDNFNLTTYRFAAINPFLIRGLKKASIPSFVAQKRDSFYKKIEEETTKKGVKSYNKSSGIFNNLVIYIRFLNESAFTVQRSVYETRLNSLTVNSLRYYYREISYNKLDMISYSFPGGSSSNICYTDGNMRSFYQPYNATTNTNGYRTDSEKTTREHSLLANAVNWATNNYSLPDGVNFDINNDGIVDNICFVVKGTSDGWNDLLWPHRWVLYSQTVKLGNLKVYGYTLQLENVSVNTFCHEMFHALGAPDLYHYTNSDNPVGPWDIMANGSCHPGAWMKYKYGGWIDQLPEIKASGTYVIKPLIQGNNNCYMLRSPFRDDQFFVLEFRKRTGTYETNLPASGLIIQRIDTRYTGNSNGPPDEIYVYRKNGGPKLEGEINSAWFSDISSRTAFSDSTNPFSFFQDGSKTGINIINIKSMTDSMSFTVSMDRPVDFAISPYEDTKITGSWKSLSSEFLVAVSRSAETLIVREGSSYNVGDTIGKSGTIIQRNSLKSFTNTGLISDEQYFYTVWAVAGNNPIRYSVPVLANVRTGVYSISKVPYVQGFDEMNSGLPQGWKSSSGPDGWQYLNQPSFSDPFSIMLNNSSSNLNEWLYTPGFDLVSSNKYMISFNYRNKTNNVAESFELLGGLDRHNNGLSLYSLFPTTSFNYKDFALYKTVLKPAFSKTYYFGFRLGKIEQGILIDDFKIEKVPLNTTQHLNPEEFYPNPSNGFITIPAIEKTTISVISANGTVLYETSIESMRVLDLSFLGKGFFLIRFKTSEKTTQGKIIIL